MQPRLTHQAELLDLILMRESGLGLVDTIRLKRDEGDSYRTIAANITEWTGHPTAYETVRRWADDWGLPAEVAQPVEETVA